MVFSFSSFMTEHVSHLANLFSCTSLLCDIYDNYCAIQLGAHFVLVFEPDNTIIILLAI